MKRAVAVLAAVLFVAASLGAAAQGKKVTYSVDAATTTPAATVVKNGQGVVVVIFPVASLDDGGTFTFRADLGMNGKKVRFPVVADMEAAGQRGLTATFDPVEVSFPDGDTVVSTDVTVILEPGSYPRHKVKMTIKARPQGGHGLGRGAGIKVVILEQASSSSTTPEQQMLRNLQEALAPDADAP
jgi:hypothetical protein